MQGDDGIAAVDICVDLVIVPGLGVSVAVPFVLFASYCINMHLVGGSDGQGEGYHTVAAVCRSKGPGIDAGISIDAVAPDILATNIDTDFICDLRSHKQVQGDQTVATCR